MNSKELINNFFHTFGLELRKYPPVKKLDKREGHIAKLWETFVIDLVMDIGAATGEYVVWIRSLGYQGKVISFEPLRRSFEILQSKANQSEAWEAVNCAAGETDGEAILNVAANADSSSLLHMMEVHEKAAPHTKVTHQERVRTVQLDRFNHPWIADAKSIFMKLDVQGYEQHVLNGSQRLMDRVSGLQVEMSLVSLYSGQVLFEEQLQILKKLGYELFYLRPGFADSRTGRLLQFDGFFFKQK